MSSAKVQRRQKIRYRIRKKVAGSATRPRMSVYRSNTEIYVQLIDDVQGKSLVSAASNAGELKGSKGTKVEVATLVGKSIASKAIAAGITDVVFDRSGFLYHGRIKALAEGAREGGLKF